MMIIQRKFGTLSSVLLNDVTTDPNVVIALCQNFWYVVLADVMHLHIYAEDGVATTN
jgi:hypothetical protein